jgi:hypothetical protein
LTLEFLSAHGEVAARFSIANPAAGDFPQWTPGSLARTNENLTVRLEKFRGGERMDAAPHNVGPKAARKTEMLFTFEEDGQPTDDWRVQKVVLSDATGNRWSPYLNLVKPGFSWAKGGEVEFLGALWPGEAAWKLDVEAVRTRGVASADLYTFETAIPAPGAITTLTNEWEHGGVTISFAGLASPNTDHPGDLKWTGKWWGEDKDKVYSLALKLDPELEGRRLQLVSATDENGADVELVQHLGQDYAHQALFFKPNEAAQKLKLVFSHANSRFVQFVARPEFEGQSDE